MPIYVYKGLETGNYYEEPLKRVITPPAIIFKGSGWHVKDYAKKDSGAKKEEGSDTNKDKED